jgi:hypothetical protein
MADSRGGTFIGRSAMKSSGMSIVRIWAKNSLQLRDSTRSYASIPSSSRVVGLTAFFSIFDHLARYRHRDTPQHPAELAM